MGYIELQEQGDSTEIVYFGIGHGLFGKGFGKSLLRAGLVKHGHDPETRRVWVHTCDFDGPHAMDVYLKQGFKNLMNTQEQVDLLTCSFNA